MLTAIECFFRERMQAPVASAGVAVDALPLACAALMFEVIRADEQIDAAEQARLRELLRSGFDLSEEDLDTLETLACREVEEAVGLYQFTQLVTRHCGVKQRITLIERLWELAFADGHLDPLETHIIQHIASLIHVRHSDMIAAKLRVRTLQDALRQS